MADLLWTDPVNLERLLRSSCPLPASFYARSTVCVARDLVGKVLVHGRCAGLIVETEAYLERDGEGRPDRAAHACRGLTPRTRVLFGPPGHAYVYLIYGRHECLNVVAEPEGRAGCVLIRALQPLSGVEEMRSRRPAATAIETLAAGPARLTLALDITRRHNGASLLQGAITVRSWRESPQVVLAVSPRIGIRHCIDWPLRFYASGNACVSRARPLSAPESSAPGSPAGCQC